MIPVILLRIEVFATEFGTRKDTICLLFCLLIFKVSQFENERKINCLHNDNKIYVYPSDKYLAACGLASSPCENGGYTGKSCTCVCPPHTTGNLCQTKTHETYHGIY